MNVVDLPAPAHHALYDEAVTRYAELVRARAIAVYRVGTVEFPGLCGVDLLVVMNRSGIDNRYYFSALHRLPRRFHPLFVHEPFILPAWSLRVIRYTTHYEPALLSGHDVLHPYQPADAPDERWCRMLEAYCSLASFFARSSATETLRGRLTLSVAGMFRYVLTDAAQLMPPLDARMYVRDIDAIQKTFFEREDPAAGVRAAYDLFAGHFKRFDAHVREWLGERDADAAVTKARALVRGDEVCEAFDREYAFQRTRDIDGYHHELASLGFPYGHLFPVATHPGAIRPLPDTPVVTNLVRNIYRVRRRLSEYAARA
jgi:hypothetical protein